MIAEVIVDIAHAEVDKIFDYFFDDIRIKCGCRVIVPFNRSFIEGIVIGIKNSSKLSNEKIKNINRLLEEMPALTDETLSLAKYISSHCFVSMASALRLFLPAEMRKGKVKEQFTKYIYLVDAEQAKIYNEKIEKKAKKQCEVIKFLLNNGKTKFTDLVKNFGASAVHSLCEKGLVNIENQKFLREPYKNLEIEAKNINLTFAQKKAIENITYTDKTVTLLFGVTGSGKTEIYLDLIDKTLSLGKTAIMLVPEISLTPQMLKQLRARFSYNAAILHSGLSAGERFDEWWRLRNGQAKIAIGARSAIFAPVENVGLIIIDEEHDGSYQSESSPRYNTLDIAQFRANYYKAKIVLGSATPSVESFLLAQKKVYNEVELTERINNKPMPEIEIVDMKKEVRRGNNSPFSQALKSEIESCLAKGNQAMIFLNQRGYSKTVICTECGHVQTCKDCDIALTYHKEDDSLLCHYCGAKYKMIKACTECGSPYLRLGGYGTEKIELDLKQMFPKAKVLRMDRDTTQNKEGHFEILNKFSSREADILVGTQMIAKGHDFPFVTLVGILDADMSLHFSDFRSSERTFQLITQVAGRSGRSTEAGRVILQTYQPENNVLQFAVKYDYKNFFEKEISVRKATSFPPFTDIVRIMIVGAEEEKTIECTKNIYEYIKNIYDLNKEKFRFFGCMKAPIKKLQGKFRYQILMRILPENFETLNEMYAKVKQMNNNKTSVYIEINPNNLI